MKWYVFIGSAIMILSGVFGMCLEGTGYHSPATYWFIGVMGGFMGGLAANSS